MSNAYQELWETYGTNKGETYLQYKFQPTYRAGMTNFLREHQIYKLLDPQPTDVVLDVGCASGRQLFQMANRIARGVGVDIAQSFVDAAEKERASHNIANLSFQQAFIEQLPFPDQSFDKIICAEVLEHVFDKDVALKELLRLLKPGGSLMITVPHLNSDGTWWGRLLRILRVRRFTPLQVFSMDELAKHGDAHVREFTKKTMRSWLAAYPLDIQKMTSVSYLDGPGVPWILKILLHVSITQRLIIGLENAISATGWLWGRHLVVLAKKR